MIVVIGGPLGTGFDLRLYDRNVKFASLVDANRDFILNRIPHVSRLMVDRVRSALEHAQAVAIGNQDPDSCNVPGRLTAGQSIVDLVRITNRRSDHGIYNGICW
jgi:GDP-mannose 6-dehydrogenase